MKKLVLVISSLLFMILFSNSVSVYRAYFCDDKNIIERTTYSDFFFENGRYHTFKLDRDSDGIGFIYARVSDDMFLLTYSVKCGETEHGKLTVESFSLDSINYKTNYPYIDT